MIIFSTVPKSGDPSGHNQKFESLDINILCCRYWWMKKWKSNKMSFPYWRLYWNKTPGAYVYYPQKYDLTPGNILLIPPNTKFSTDIDSDMEGKDYTNFDLVGNRINSTNEEKKYINEGNVTHFFVHFTLGGQLDYLCDNIINLKIKDFQIKLIQDILNRLLSGAKEFKSIASMEVYQLILSAVCQIPEEMLYKKNSDSRINVVMDVINQHIQRPILNTELARHVNMSTNSFCRLFRSILKCSPQEYIQSLRIGKACDLLDHSSLSIELISEKCGYSDRFHFSKVFKKVKGIAPAEYKKRYSFKEV